MCDTQPKFARQKYVRTGAIANWLGEEDDGVVSGIVRASDLTGVSLTCADCVGKTVAGVVLDVKCHIPVFA